MKTKQAIVDTLNAALTHEMTSINRYFLHARMFANWGLEVLNKVNYKKSIKDMKQADVLIERILFLEGLPNLQKLDMLNVGEHAEEMLAADLKFEEKQIASLKKDIDFLEDEQDYVSRSLLCDILEYEEAHLDWIETQQHQISTMGISNYLQSQIEEAD